MRVSRIYSPQALVSGTTVTLNEQTSHYVSKVLRMTGGTPLVLFNGQGNETRAEITHISKKAVECLIQSEHQPETESPLTTILGIGISRGERMDYAIQKSTELGVSAIVPLFTEFCEVKLNAERAAKRQQHWQQIAISACEQSGRVKIPPVLTPRKLSDWLASDDEYTPAQCSLRLMCDHEQSEGLPATKPDGAIALITGPEGGISDTEKRLLNSAEFQGLVLGPRVLRTETAPLVALSVIQYLWS